MIQAIREIILNSEKPDINMKSLFPVYNISIVKY